MRRAGNPEDRVMERQTESLHRRWVRASYAIGRIGEDPFGGHLTYEIQSLGRLDAELRAQDPAIEALFADENREESLDLSRYLDLSRLWVLGGYELVRTLSATVNAELWAPADPIAGRLQEVKRTFALVRIPLAKYEPAFQGGRAKPGDLIAEPAFTPGQGATWVIEVGSDEFRIMPRNSLADLFLEFLEEVRRANPALPNG